MLSFNRASEFRLAGKWKPGKELSCLNLKMSFLKVTKRFLREKYRSPSKGGNTKALHSHVLTIDGGQYSFLALGTKQWAYKSDTVSFEYEISGNYLNIKKRKLLMLLIRMVMKLFEGIDDSSGNCVQQTSVPLQDGLNGK